MMEEIKNNDLGGIFIQKIEHPLFYRKKGGCISFAPGQDPPGYFGKQMDEIGAMA
jgi:hypothetical protein